MQSFLLLVVISEVVGSGSAPCPNRKGSSQIFRALERTTLNCGNSCWSRKDFPQWGEARVSGEKPFSSSVGKEDSVVVGRAILGPRSAAQG